MTTTEQGDIGISGSMGGLSFAVVADTDDAATSTSFSLAALAGGTDMGLGITDDCLLVEPLRK